MSGGWLVSEQARSLCALRPLLSMSSCVSVICELVDGFSEGLASALRSSLLSVSVCMCMCVCNYLRCTFSALLSTHSPHSIVLFSLFSVLTPLFRVYVLSVHHRLHTLLHDLRQHHTPSYK
jgi:hypothetical protein